MWYVLGAAAGPTSVTVKMAGKDGGLSANLSEWNGAGSWSHDADSSCNTGKSANPATGALITSQEEALVVAGCSQAGSISGQIGQVSGFTALNSGGTKPAELIAYALANSSLGPFDVSWAMAGKAKWACGASSFINH